MLAKGQAVIQIIETLAPKRYALADDRIGLQLGSLQKSVSKVLVALDVTDEVVEEAISEQAELIIAHHAIIYQPLKHIITDYASGRLYEKLIKHDIAVYITHTNLDIAVGGINDMMADALQLKEVKILREEFVEPSQTLGLGRVGRIAPEVKLKQFVNQVKAALAVPTVRVVGDLERNIRKVAVLGGAGSRYIKDAIFAGADVLVTGDIDYHTAHDALAAGLAIIDPGHNAEKIMKQQVANYLQQQFQHKRYGTTVLASTVPTEPFTFM